MAELARVLAPGARIALLDATEPRGLLRPLFDLDFRLVAPALGAVAGRKGAYQYLASSLAQIPLRTRCAGCSRKQASRTAAPKPLTFGVVTLFTGSRAR